MAHMKKTLIILIALSLGATVESLNAQTRSRQASAGRAEKPNSQIQKMVREISARNIEAIINRLVSFGTRHSLSETESNTQGIGAARRWIKSELERYSRESGGRLKVEFDEFMQQ